jgi:hypothetical protein
MKFTQVSLLYPMIISYSESPSQVGHVKVSLYRGPQTDNTVLPIEIVVEDTGSVSYS